MKTTRNIMFASVSVLALVLTLALTAPGRAIAQTTGEPLRVVLEGIGRIVGDVRITNAADSPIPTRVEGPIEIVSTSAAPVLTRRVLRPSDTFSKEVTINLTATQFSGIATFHVPATKLLAIEGFSGFAQVAQPAWQYPQVRFKTTTNGDTAWHLVFANQGGGGWFLSAPGWGGNQAYADPGSTVEVFFSRPLLGSTAATGSASMTLTFVGHYVDQ